MHLAEQYRQSRQGENLQTTSKSEGHHPQTIPPAWKSKRLLPLDALRGLIIVLMALDHTSYYLAGIHPEEFWGLPLPQYSTALAFLTRWLTHLAAPGFFFLMGTAMILFADSRQALGWSKGKIIRFFALRGALLILIQVLVVNPAWLLASPTLVVKLPGGDGEAFWLYHAGVLYGLGATMIVAAFGLNLDSKVLAAVSGATILAVQLLMPSPEKVAIPYSPLARLLLIPGQTGRLQVYYPLLPWLGLVGMGIIFGQQLLRDRKRAYQYALIFGLAFLLLFGAMRYFTSIGDFHPVDKSSWMGFLNVTKYPPSLMFILLTIGLNLILLYGLAKAGDRLATWGAPLLTFGRVALFFYVVHLYLYGFIGLAIPDVSLAMVYPWCLVGLLLLYPLCIWYGNFKQQTSPQSLWRLF